VKRAAQDGFMALYEHVFIARQDITNAQAEALIEHFGQILKDQGGDVSGSEYWGLRSMAYRINKNRKGHYCFLRSAAPSEAVHEMERLMRLHEDVMRVLTVRVEAHEEGESAVIRAKASRDGDRGRRGGRGGRRDD
jgi:small subunit ribosomal protein S6